ncbi:MAG TPA: class I SAM-dependent methyltransferase [Elusimicrobiota bacterium]|jgi:SAM-dependent methyltransferase|nr:class I SAM-dependent methyltransferase [Elusimicrobiota bacterium]
MAVSKAHDETSTRSTEAQDGAPTPAPTRKSSEEDGQTSTRAVGAGMRRARVGSAVARERSGPIGIASGDFATPSVRRRTITQPRGTPIVGVPLSMPLAPEPEVEAPAPPPPLEVPALGATPVDLVDGGASSQSSVPASALDSPFSGSSVPAGPADGEAAALAAEAAAVRALDSGPLTPPPEVPVVGPTPPPEAKAALAEEMQATPPPALATPSAPPPLPSPDSPPQETTTAADIAGALPVRPMGSDGSAASSDLANQIGSPTPSPAIGGEPDVELQGSDELVVEEGAEPNQAAAGDSAAPAASRPPVSPAATPPPTPPPIPGSYLKTPGPELKLALPSSVEEAHGPLLPALPILPEALSQRPRRPKRSKPWFEEVFDEDYLRTLPFMRADQTLREVEFISNALTAPAGSEILDVGCGYGRHAIELVQRGFNVTGLDLSLPLLIRAADEAQRRSLSVNFVHADMREMAFEKQFDGAYSMLTSFGYFDEETNLRVAERIGRALKPGKRFLLDILNRDYVVSDLPVRVWWEGTGCVVLEEVDFNFHTSRINTHRSIVFEDGRQLEQELSVRAYSLHEIGRLLRQAGFRVIDVSGGLATRGDFFGGASRNLLIVAEKREDDA